jgi:hypothetical protein
MRQALLVVAALSMVTTPAFAQACGDDGRYFHLKPPGWSIDSARRHAIHRKARALRWYREHLGNSLICPESNVEGISVSGSSTSTTTTKTTKTTTTTKTKKSK